MRLVWHIFLLAYSYGDGISMYVIIIISKDPDIVGTTPIYVHYKRWMTLGSWTFFCIPLYGPQINCVLYSAQPHHARLCGFIKCWQRIFRHVCIYVCLFVCVRVWVFVSCTYLHEWGHFGFKRFEVLGRGALLCIMIWWQKFKLVCSTSFKTEKSKQSVNWA